MFNRPDIIILIVIAVTAFLLTIALVWVTSRHFATGNETRPFSLETTAIASLLEKREREFNLLYTAGKELGQTLDLISIYRTVHRVVSTSMPCSTLIVSSFDQQTEQIRCVYVNHTGEEHDVSGFPPIPLEKKGSGIQSDVIHSRESLLINDFQARMRQTEGTYYIDDQGAVHDEAPEEAEDTRSAMLIPMMLNNQVHGILQVQSHLLNAYNISHLRLLEMFVPQVTAARNNALLYQQAQTELAERIRAQEAEKEQRIFVEALRDTAVSLNSTFDLEEIFDHLLQYIQRVIPFDGINIILFEGKMANMVRHQSSHSYYESYRTIFNNPVPINQINNFIKLTNEKKPILIPNTDTEPTWTALPHTVWIKSYVGVPIVIGDETIGSLNIDAGKPDFFSAKHVKQLQAFANYTAVAIQHSRLYHELSAQNELLEGAVITRTAELQHAMDQVNAILTNSPDATLLLDTDGQISTFNPASRFMFGWADDDALPPKLQQCLASQDQIKLFDDAFKAVLNEGQPNRLSALAIRVDGTTFDAQIALAPIRRNGLIANIICSIHDISTLKEVERMKDAFVSNVSHELRTPLASLRLHSDLMQRNPQKNGVYLDRIVREIDRLHVLIEDLLQLSRLDQDRTPIGQLPLNVIDLVTEYVMDRQILAEEKGQHIEYEFTEPLPLILGDEGLIGQVLSILLTNAINYTPEYGRITVSTLAIERDLNHWVGLQVKDNGPGIVPNEQKNIFDRFYRGETGQESGAPGTGLGLSIAREIVRRHQGTIEVESEGVPGKGVTFTIWLPGTPNIAHQTDHPTNFVQENGIQPSH